VLNPGQRFLTDIQPTIYLHCRHISVFKDNK
jgi:hypothetical protein